VSESNCKWLRIDAAGRLRIPADLVKAAGIVGGESVHLIAERQREASRENV
jgi:DNA-binding transcriptional regulator/RsmH inhibitor MraZ